MNEKLWTAPVHEFMSTKLVSVRLDAQLVDVQRTLERHDISTVPVVDDGGTLRGILSSKDLLRAARLEMAAAEYGLSLFPRIRRAADLMRTSVLTIDERATIGNAGSEMVRHRVHRLIVVREGRPYAVVSTRDAMRAIAMAGTATPLADVMTRELPAIDSGRSIEEAVTQLDESNVQGLVVVEGDWPVGVFTHIDALHALAMPSFLRKLPVERVLSHEIICLHTSTPLYRVAQHARNLRARRILAVNERRVRGIATGLEVLRVMAASTRGGA
jgi:predicted transcriptional regulator